MKPKNVIEFQRAGLYLPSRKKQQISSIIAQSCNAGLTIWEHTYDYLNTMQGKFL
jgi:hypothetical protein